ncbi:MAG: Bug family tripartite tricarboxylate transporter substrate binding protein, partial [Candidatus Levyibacteriota bacterium]
GQIAVDYVRGAAPDGYTLLLANNGANAIVPSERGAARAGPMAEFAPVTMLARLPIVVVVGPALDVTTLAQLIEHARAAPGKLFYASGALGSTSHTAATLLFRRAGVHVVDVPYAGTSVAVKDVLAGEVPVLFTHLGTVATLIEAGRLRALAVTGSHRMAGFPDLRTVAECGYPGFDVTTWHGVAAPPGTARGIIARLHDALARIVGRDDVRRQLAAMGMEPVGDTPEAFARAIASDVRQWAEVFRTLHGTRR